MTDQEREYLYDESLVLRIQLGESSAFDELVSRWQDRLWRCARMQTGDDTSAWDVLQETWLAVINKIRRLDNPRAFPVWVYRILISSAVDRQRRRGREARHREKLASESSQTSASNDAIPGDTVQRLSSALATLSPEHLTVINLYYSGGLSVKDIAETLDVPEGTIKSRLHQARRELREQLRGETNE